MTPDAPIRQVPWPDPPDAPDGYDDWSAEAIAKVESGIQAALNRLLSDVSLFLLNAVGTPQIAAGLKDVEGRLHVAANLVQENTSLKPDAEAERKRRRRTQPTGGKPGRPHGTGKMDKDENVDPKIAGREYLQLIQTLTKKAAVVQMNGTESRPGYGWYDWSNGINDNQVKARIRTLDRWARLVPLEP
jgi:hypothetical protein